MIEYPNDNTVVANCLEVPVVIEKDTYDKAAKLTTEGTFPDELGEDMSYPLVTEYDKRCLFEDADTSLSGSI